MSLENDKEVAKMIRSVRTGKVPASLLKNFEAQTWGKIHAATARAALISTAGMLGITTAALALALWIYLLPAAPQTAALKIEHVIKTEPALNVVQALKNSPAVGAIPATAGRHELPLPHEQAVFNQLNHDLLLLELLGEDSGLLDDPDSDVGLIETALALPGF